MLSIFLGFIGVYEVLTPGCVEISIFSIFPLIAATAAAYVSVSIKKLSYTDSNESILFNFFFTMMLLTLPFVVFDWANVEWEYIKYLITIGFFMGVSQIFVMLAYRYAMPGKLAPFNYSEIAFSIILGFLFFGHVPSPSALLGLFFIIISAAVMFTDKSTALE